MQLTKLMTPVVLVFIVICAMSFRRVYVLQPKDTIGLAVVPKEPSAFVVSGGMTHSFMMVTQSTVQDQGERLVLRVYIAPIQGAGGAGSFRSKVNVSSHTNELWFGDPPGIVTIGSLFGFKVRLPCFRCAAVDGLIWKRQN